LGNSEDFAMQMFGNLFGSMLEGIFAPPRQDTSYQKQLMHQQMEKQKQEAMKKQAIIEWENRQKEREARMALEKAQKKKRGQEVLAGINRTGVGPLKPFRWETSKLEARPIGTGVFDTSGYTSWQRLICSSYFSSKALDAARGGNPEGARFMNTQADRVTAGEMTDVECQLPGLQQFADIQQHNFKENTRLTKMVKLMPVIQGKVKHLQQIEIKLHEAQEEKKEAEIKLDEAEVKVEEANLQIESAQTPEEEAQADDLLQQALALQDEALAQVEEAKQAEEESTKLKDESLGELKDLKEKIEGGGAKE
jgi:hypothetical protein